MYYKNIQVVVTFFLSFVYSFVISCNSWNTVRTNH